jgi:hypothetical protein
MAVVSILRSHRQLDIDPKEIPDHIESVRVRPPGRLDPGYIDPTARCGSRFCFDRVTKSGYD